jgi:hypothetical protein
VESNKCERIYDSSLREKNAHSDRRCIHLGVEIALLPGLL